MTNDLPSHKQNVRSRPEQEQCKLETSSEPITIVTLRSSISSSDGIMFYRLWYLKIECNLFLSGFFSLGFLFVWVFNLFIMFVNSLDSGSVAESRVLSREHTHVPTTAGSIQRHSTYGN